MVDTAHGPNGGVQDESAELRALAAELRSLETTVLFARMQFARKMGLTFDGSRDMQTILGYENSLSVADYLDRYARGGIAGRIVDAFPNACWRGSMELVEDEDPEKETPFEKAWNDLERQHQAQSKFLRVDKLARLSTYATLLIGAPGELSEPLPKGKPGGVLYLTPFLGGGGPGNSRSQQQAVADAADCTIHEYDTDPTSKRFGLPLSYQLRRTDVASPALMRPVHWSRMIHVAENVLQDEVFGQPALERVWNLLNDLDKVTGGGAEAFWMRANAGLHVNVDKDVTFGSTPAEQQTELDRVKAQIEEYKHQLTRVIRTRGTEISQLGSDVANFALPSDAILTQIAGATSMPKRILTGSEQGELASSQDRDNWKDQINGRQTQHCAPVIVRALADRLIAYGYLPAPAEGPDAYEVRWPHIETMTEKDKTEGAKAWATVNATQGSVVFTDDEIRDKWHGMAPLDDEQLQKIAEQKAQKVKDAQEMMQATTPPTPEPDKDEELRAAEDVELLRVLEAAIVAGNDEVVLKIVGLQDGPHEFGTTQVQLPPDVAEKLLALGRAIPDADIYEPAEGGRETDAHITVCYGLIGEPSLEKMQAALARGWRYGTVTLGKTGIFQTPNYDVVFVTAKSQDLANLHQAVETAVPVRFAPREYFPHATVAYVKPGTGAKYAGWADLEGETFKFDSVVMSNKDGVRQEVRLA